MKNSQILSSLFLVIVTGGHYSNGITVDEDLSLTTSQNAILNKFREKVTPLLYRDFMHHDIYLIRWLRARDFDLKAAETMLRAHLKWRKDQKMDTIFEEDWSDMIRDFQVTMDSYDKQGRPVGTIDIYDWDIRKAVIAGKGKRGLRYVNMLMENLTMSIFAEQEKGKNVTQFTVVGNAEGFNLIEHGCPICLPLWIEFAQTVENHYNGWYDEIIVIDATPAINVVLEAIRPFLSRYTRNALKIFGLNKQKWTKYLDERISKRERRPQYGGTKPL